MRLALLLGSLLAVAAGSRLLAQDETGCPNGQCNQCNSGQCSANGVCKNGHCCRKLGPGEKACARCIGSICHHPPHHGNRAAQYRASLTPWHGNYYYTQWGAPVALVIPPNAEMHTDYSWGVPASRVSRNDHQFHRGLPGGTAGYGGGYGFLPTPYYPSDTDQFGVYYVRGPW
jgi:hypothetical protein